MRMWLGMRSPGGTLGLAPLLLPQVGPRWLVLLLHVVAGLLRGAATLPPYFPLLLLLLGWQWGMHNPVKRSIGSMLA